MSTRHTASYYCSILNIFGSGTDPESVFFLLLFLLRQSHCDSSPGSRKNTQAIYIQTKNRDRFT